MNTEAPVLRRVRSFVLRQGRAGAVREMP